MEPIPFNKAICLEDSMKCVEDAIRDNRLSGNGRYTKLCSEWLENRFGAKKVLMTTSCTAALEMAAMLLGIKEGDEVIMPSYTFVTTASAFARQGAKIVFVDVKPRTMNIDEKLIAEAITEKTKAIVVVHYAGIACNMDEIMEIANAHNIPVVEDAAQGVMSTYKGRYLGTIGAIGCYSFHDTKNYTMGEGGALLINDEKYIGHAEIIWEKGTDRSKFFRGEIDKYSWVDLGSSYLPSELNVAFLWPQLKCADEINDNRKATWNRYYRAFAPFVESGKVELPMVPDDCEHNAHMFWLKLKNLETRSAFLKYMRDMNRVGCVFHFVPLHSSKAGMKYGRFFGEDVYTTSESERIVRFPLFYGITDEQVNRVLTLAVEWIKENA